ncbi:MAG TPA: hypothetical protein VE978_05945 [Chitinophagales bacterium]|nr:hypothetical protein [Chitinophagales bacterium]
MTKKFALASLFLAVIAFSACQKTGFSPASTESILATDNARIDNESDNVDALVNAIALTNGMSLSGGKLEGPGIFGNITLPVCATVTIDTSSDPKSITIDFGSTPCLCDQWDGLYRQGVVEAQWTGPYHQAGSVLTITTTNYFRGVSADQMDQIDFNKTVTNTGLNASGNMQFHSVATVNITYFNGETANYAADKIKEWTEGASTSDLNDDVYSITGSVTGTNRNGVAFTATITTPIIRNACQWYVSGVVELVRANLPTITLDYGNGNCDNVATITVNGQTITITLK